MNATTAPLRRFRPSLAATLALATLATAFAALGAWQWQRAADKQVLQERFADRTVPPLEVLPGMPVALSRVRIEGEYDNRRAFLVDNRVLHGRAGVHVLSPFRIASPPATILVNRGWLPLPADRSTLPVVPGVHGRISVSGHLDLVRQPGLTVGDADRLDGDHWPKLLTYPEQAALETALATPLYPMTLYLSPGQPGALQGLDWDPFPMPAARHRGYAVTWFALALTSAGAWVILGMHRARRTPA